MSTGPWPLRHSNQAPSLISACSCQALRERIGGWEVFFGGRGFSTGDDLAIGAHPCNFLGKREGGGWERTEEAGKGERERRNKRGERRKEKRKVDGAGRGRRERRKMAGIALFSFI